MSFVLVIRKLCYNVCEIYGIPVDLKKFKGEKNYGKMGKTEFR